MAVGVGRSGTEGAVRALGCRLPRTIAAPYEAGLRPLLAQPTMSVKAVVMT